MSIPSSSTRPARRSRFFRPIRLSTFLLLVMVIALLVSLFLQRLREQRLRDAIAVYRHPRAEALIDALDRPLALDYPDSATLDEMLKEVRRVSIALRIGKLPGAPPGIAIYVDPIGLQEAGQSMDAKIRRPKSADSLTLGEHLRRILDPMGLGYDFIGDSRGNGFLMITAQESLDVAADPYVLYRDVLR